MKKLVLLTLTLITTNIFAQNYVTIPDANFAKYLKEAVPNAMNGNQLDASSADVKNLKTIDAEARAIKNLEGVQYFIGLETLVVGTSYYIPDSIKNQFSTLPMLPENLKVLVCGNSSLDSLPELPKSLKILRCYSNSLKSLPLLPDSLRTLECSGNQLSSLPKLPDLLIYLDCSYNGLTSLPQLPVTLTFLDCSSNQLLSLPLLPNSLINIQCHLNQLLDLPQLPQSLKELSCYGNQLTSIPQLPNSLISLVCAINQITSLPSLPDSLTILRCQGNLITALPQLPNTLTELLCNYNQLKTLPSFPNSLEILYCNSNQLTSLPELPNTLNELTCSENQLKSLPELPENLESIICDNNQIKCFPTFPNIKKSGYINFQISNNPFTCLPNYIPAMDSITLTYPLCEEQDINNQAGCEIGKRGVVGYTFFNDSIASNIPVVLLDENKNQLGVTYTASNGVYQFVKDSANYHVQIDTTNIPFKVVYPASNDTLVSITKATPFADSVNFNLTCKDGFDVGIRSVATSGIVFPGQPHAIHISAGDMSNWFGKQCAKGISGQLQITVTGPVQYNGSAGIKSPTINGNVYTYDIADFGNINFTEDFGLSFVTDTTAKADDQICVVAQITPTNGDYNLSNNNYEFCYYVINSHDPNLKEVYPANFKPGYEGYFTYTIHFQNTGNAPAFNIRLLDTLDKAFDLTTFEVLNYSHANRVSLNGNIMNVYFKNIQLQDSTSNEEESHGFIQYRIKPKKAVSESDQIKNTAHIYFDFNEAVVTNTTISTANKSSGLESKKESILHVYPNPAETSITLVRASSSNSKLAIQITNVNGQEVYTTSLEKTTNHMLDISAYTPGMYFINVTSDTSNEVLKVIKK